MVADILKFPPRKKRPPKRKIPRQRVFPAGIRYWGPPECKAKQHIYFKRHANEWWSFNYYQGLHVRELERFRSAVLLDKLKEWKIFDHPDHDGLEGLGWRQVGGDNVCQLKDYQPLKNFGKRL